MLELHHQHTGDQLTVTLGQYCTTISLVEIVIGTSKWHCIYDDAVAYGRELFDRTLHEEQMIR
jgi:hypothetical protein